jgi:hypothetical protein
MFDIFGLKEKFDLLNFCVFLPFENVKFITEYYTKYFPNK